MSIGRDGVAACALGQSLFAVGGSDGQQYLRLVESYDPRTNTWNKVRQHVEQGETDMWIRVKQTCGTR